MSRRVVWVALVLLLLAGGLLPGKAVASFVLSGQVVTETGAPVEGASVEVTKSRSGYEQGLRWLDEEPEPEVLDATVTDETGWYRVEVPRPGMWRVAVDAPGYVPMERRPEAYVGEERLATVTLVPDAGLPVTVTAAGKPLPNARVWAASTLGPDGPWATFDLRQWRPSWPGRFTDQRGRATVPRARDERLRVVAWKDGFRQVEEADAAGPVKLETEAVAERRVVRVVDAGGKPVKQALIRVGDTPSWSAGTTDEEGLWDLAPPGGDELTLRADAGDGRWATETFEAPEEETLVLELPEPTVLSGRVSDAETGASLGGALVFRDRSGRVAETGDDGSYLLAFSEPADHESVRAVAPGHRLSTARVPMPPAGALSFVLEPVSSLRGRVVTRSGAPLAGATVRLVHHPMELHLGFEPPGGSHHTSTTDPEGRFLIIQVSDSSDQRLLARADGFAPAVEPLPKVPEEEVELVLGPGSILEGRVVDGDGEPVTGARVRLFSEIRIEGRLISETQLSGAGRSSEFDVTTGDEGRFRFSQVPPGDFTLQADAEGFASRLLTGVEVPKAEETVEMGDVALQQGVVLEGFVTDPQGRPMAEARVTVAEGEAGALAILRSMGRSRGVVSEMLTEADGRFRFDDLRPDTVYSVGAVREGRVPDVKVTEVPAPEPLELVLGAGGRLFGQVTTGSGEPVSRGMVRTEAAAPDPSGPFWPGLGQRDRLSEDGTFSLEAVAPGSVTVYVHDDQGMSSEHGPFEVAPGVEMGPLELVHEGDVAMLEGRVLGSDGEPAGNVRVSWESSLPGVGGSSVTADATGRFRFHGVKPGPATVSAWHPERGQASREVVLHPGREHVELILGPGLQVAGRVVGPEGQPVTQGRARVHPVTANPSPAQMRSFMRSMTRLGPDGSFAIPVEAPGDYGLRVEAPGFVPYTTPRDDLLNVGSEPVEGLVVRLERGGRIVGRISGLDEDEWSRVEVRAQRSEPPQEHRIGQVDHRGRYEIGSIDAGTWVVTATTDQPPRQVTREVVVPETGGETPLDLAFPEHELTLRGQVLLDGNPVSGAQVYVRSAADPQGSPVGARTDSFGRFRIAGLLPDRYVVQAFQRSFGRGISLRGYRELEVVADQEIVLDLERVEPETE